MAKLTDDEFYKKLKESVKMLSSLIENMEEDGNASIKESEEDFESDFGSSEELMMDGMGDYPDELSMAGEGHYQENAPEEDNRFFGLNYDANGDSI